jgi:hypothetical protein
VTLSYWVPEDGDGGDDEEMMQMTEHKQGDRQTGITPNLKWQVAREQYLETAAGLRSRTYLYQRDVICKKFDWDY